MKNKITTLIFDLGGVIINIDPSLTIKKFNSLAKKNQDILNGLDYKLFKSNKKLKFFFDFEKGLISENIFRNSLNNLIGINLINNDFDRVWNKLILSVNYNIVDLIISLKSKFNVFVLSNTNSIHEKFYNDIFIKKYNLGLKDIFHKVYYSHEIYLRKPEIEIYKLILDDNNILGNEVLFFDDINDNLIFSKKLNFNTFEVLEIDQLEKFLKSFR
tara:strand:- start:132 stop:776 length:645 start_codon:yes stop_codon:yes gene_type:complete